MLLKRIYDVKLAQASYLVGCSATGEALVIDANRDIEQYMRAAADEGLRVTHVTETHIHADFVSGSRELAQRAGARLLLSDEGDADWKYRFAAESSATLLEDGDQFMVGNLRFDVMHTPGHTPEHLTFVVTDTPATDRPMGAFTGDFIFVGDVGRPDLLEKAANMSGTMVAGAKTLYRSIERFKALPDYLQLFPGHGAGSACGKALGAVPSTSLGYEKIANWGLTVRGEAEFVQMVLAGQPEPPKYFAEMKRINKEGPALLGGFVQPARLPSARLAPLLAKNAIVIDTRSAAEYAEGYIPGTINIPLDKSFSTWAGWLVPYGRDFYLIIGGDAQLLVREAVRDLTMIGLDHVTGFWGSDVIKDWSAAGGSLDTVPQLNVGDLAEQMRTGQMTVIDVRGRSEWAAGHLPNAEHIPVGYLSERLDEIPRATPVAVHCQSGARSAIAASILSAHGFTNVANLTGGFAAWQAAGEPVEQGEAAFPASWET